MVFGSMTKNPLMSTLTSRHFKDAKNERSSLDMSSDMYEYTNKNASLTKPISFNEEHLLSASEQVAYDFEELKDEVQEEVVYPSMILLPFPLPNIEPTPTQDLDIDTSDVQLKEYEKDARGIVSFRWNAIKSQFTPTKTKNSGTWMDDFDTLKPFFTCGETFTNITLMNPQCSHEEKFNENDKISLLQDQAVHKASKYFKNPKFQTPLQQKCGSTKRTNGSPSVSNDEDLYTNLIETSDEICHDWLRRQLAFDLDYLEDIDTKTTPDVEFSSDGPEWALQMEDISVDTPPPPPPPPPPPSLGKRKKNERKGQLKKKGELLFEKVLLEVKLPTDSDTKVEQSIFEKYGCSEDKTCEVQTTNKSFDLENDSCLNIDADLHIKDKSNRNVKQKYHRIAPVNNRFGRYSVRRSVSVSVNNSRTSRSLRRRNGRRGPPILSGRQFATNLSTVTERPSEEEATSSYMLTPMSCKQRQFFTTYNGSDVSFDESLEDTAETCSSSKDSTVLEKLE